MKCPVCGQSLDSEECTFYKESSSGLRDGKQYRCPSCSAEYVRVGNGKLQQTGEPVTADLVTLFKN